MRCTRTQKTMYRTELDARLAISRIQLSNKKHRLRQSREEPKRAYCCEFCHRWHITSQTKRKDEERVD